MLKSINERRVTARGTAAALRIESKWIIDPDIGDAIEETWQGLRNSILSLAQGFKEAGGKAIVTHQGALWRCIVTWSQTPAGDVEIPVDKYEFDTEIFETSIWNIPGATAEAASYIDQAQYRKDIEDSVNAGDAYPLNVGSFPWGYVVYKMLLRGVRAYPLKRIVLRRVRTFALQYVTRITLQANPVAYYTATLVSGFAIPAIIAAQLPANPSASFTPQGTAWAWWMRTDRSEQIPALNKVEEVKEWVFAAWETALYSFA